MLKDKDSKQSIQVTIRVRPLSQKQKNQDPRICVYLQQLHSLKVVNAGQVKKFTFDSICFEQPQQQIFERVGRRCTLDCLEGYNCTIFAYGQTGAGKTYTMMGVNSEHQNYENHKGLIPRTMKYLFECIDNERAEGVTFVIRCYFLQIYNEQIIDLLNKSNNNMQLREDTRKGVYVEGITEQVVSRSDQVMDLLNKGSKSRHVGSTFYNETSSRSHSVFTMQIESRYSKNGVINTKSRQFNFVDLAGSERTKQSTGQRLKEGCNINKSLMNLASVINALSQVSEGKAQHVNYRNSKLTFLLKDSLGGNSKTNLIANISPAAIFYQQTISTLGFARRAKLIKREKASINEDSSGNLQSMKNEIKRLKQEVITLMGRLQSGEGIPNMISNEPPAKMTTIMHQYVAEEIDKQTRLEMEILRLNERINHLQSGLKHYSANDTHLRMIISVLEDKITRLRSIESALSIRAHNIPETQETVRTVKEYFENQRLGLIQQLQSFKGQSQGTRIIKQLLKQARVIREDGEEQQSLKVILSKNTEFLSLIHDRLQQMKPEKQENVLNEQFQNKITSLEIQYSQRLEEQQERTQQINLELTEARMRFQQNQKLLQEAISGQIMLQQRVKTIEGQKQQAVTQLDASCEKIRKLQSAIFQIQQKKQEEISELSNNTESKEMQNNLLKKQVDGLKGKIEKLNLNQTMLKKQFQILEEEKEKIDKMLLLNIEQMKEQKNILLRNELQISRLNQIVQQNKRQKIQYLESVQKLNIEYQNQRNTHKLAMTEIQQQHKKMIQEVMNEKGKLEKEISCNLQKIKNFEIRLSEQSEQVQTLAKQFSEMQNNLKKELIAKEGKIKQFINLINKKEENGNQIQYELNKANAQIINISSQKEEMKINFQKNIEQLKQKIVKEHKNFDQIQHQFLEQAKLYDQLNNQYSLKRKEINELTEQKSKILAANTILQQNLETSSNRIEILQTEIEGMKDKERQQRVLIMQSKNQLFVVQKNAEIQVDALRSQLTLKEHHIDQLQRQQNKTKLKFQKELQQLNKQLIKSKETFQQHQSSLKKSMQLQLLSKQKKLLEIRTSLSQKQDKNRQNQLLIIQLSSKIESLQTLKNQKEQEITKQKQVIANLNNQIVQLKTQNEESLQKQQIQVQQLSIVHNEQIDQKNEQIQNFMMENESLTKQIIQLKNTQETIQSKILQLKQNAAILQAEKSSLNNKCQQLMKNNEQMKISILKQEQQKNKITQTYNQIIQQSQEKIQTLNSQINQIQQIKQEMSLTMDNLKSQIEVKQQQIKGTKNILINVKSEAESLKIQIQEAIKESSIFNTSVQQLKRQNQQKESYNALMIKQLDNRRDFQSQKLRQIQMLHLQNETLKRQLIVLQQCNSKNSQKVIQLNQIMQELKFQLQNEKQSAKQVKITLQNQIYSIENDKKVMNTQINGFKQQFNRLNGKIQQFQHQVSSLKQNQKNLLAELAREEDQNQSLSIQLKEVDSIKNQINILLEEMKQKSKKQIQKSNFQISDLKAQNVTLANQIILLGKTIKQIQVQRASLKEDNNNMKVFMIKHEHQLEEFLNLKQKYEIQHCELDRLIKTVQDQQKSKERLYAQVCRQRENNSNFKLIIQNSEAQIRQLEVQLQQKDAIYKKLLEKIAKNENQSKKTTNSEHYLKTIQLLQKSRSEQLQLRRQNQELKKTMTNMKQTLQQKQTYVRDVEKKSEGYCVSMHKRLEQIQKDYCELQRNQEKIIKQKKNLEKLGQQNELLKEEVKNYKINASKMIQKQEDLQNRFKQCNLDYISLEKQFEQLKKSQILVNNHDQRTNFLNRLKAQVAALKTQKVLLTDSLNKQREQKTKLKAQFRYGKDDVNLKVELQKKVNENKNLQQLIFQIVSHLKICVNEPKTKLQAIRSVILGTIKQKNNEIKTLKEKIKEFEDNMQQSVKVGLRQPALREFKVSNVSGNRSQGATQELFRYQKDKDPTVMDNLSRQKMREFQNHYARLKQNDQFSKYKNI